MYDAAVTNTDNPLPIPHERIYIYRLSFNVGTVLVLSYDNQNCDNMISKITISLFSYRNRMCMKKPTQSDRMAYLHFC